MTEFRNKLHGLMDDGAIDPREMANMLIMWLSEDEAEEFCANSDISEYLEEEEEEEEPEEVVDGVQFRYIIITEDLNYFKAELYRIEDDGTDSMEPVYVVEGDTLNMLLNADVEPLSCEEVIDYYWSTLNGNPYCDHYLESNDPVVWTEE